jgi:hypothetical protein
MALVIFGGNRINFKSSFAFEHNGTRKCVQFARGVAAPFNFELSAHLLAVPEATAIFFPMRAKAKGEWN